MAQFANLRDAVAAELEKAHGIPENGLNEVFTLDKLPPAFSLSSLREAIVPEGTKDRIELVGGIVLLDVCLRESSRVQRHEGDAEHISKLYDFVTEALKPPRHLLPYSDFEERPPKDDKALSQFHELSRLSVHNLDRLDLLLPLSHYPRYSSLIKVLACFTDTRDSWTGNDTQKLVTAFLARYQSLLRQEEVLVEECLQRAVRPAFSSSRPSTVTSQGRKAMFRSAEGQSSFIDETSSKPWKFGAAYTVTLFQWVLQNLLVWYRLSSSDHWPLLVPPILALLDDESVMNKAKGAELLSLLLELTSSALLTRTGLFDVFRDALLPCLHYLPTLTPQHESILILNETYPALRTIARVRYPTRKDEPERSSFLDGVLREGLLSGYSHCAENVAVSGVLMKQLSKVVDALGIDSTKHLKSIIPLLISILTDPFSNASPSLLMAAMHTLQTVVLNSWPRIAHWRGDILLGLTVCWIKLQEDPIEEKQELERGLTDILKLLTTAVGSEVDWNCEVESLMRVRTDLTGLFQPVLDAIH
ncbi:MAG: hypothetical protein M1833_003431 [Piccolia ochrophora]|nr:MAG: hypothetical protein M1833_003431 [Piccolia ochrophora]